jgi:hypothetical protein
MPVPRSSPAVSAARLRYAPQRQALAQAVQEARAEHQAAIAGAQSEARLNAGAVANAVPAVTGIYDRAAAQSQAARAALGAQLTALGPAAASFAAAAGTEGAVGAERTAREAAAAQAALQSQSTAVAAAPAFGRTLADSQLAKTLSKIFSSAQGVSAQEADAIGTNLDSERREAHKDALTRRGQNITAKNDAESRRLQERSLNQSAKQHAEDLAYKEAHPSGSSSVPTLGGVKQLPTSQQNKAASEVARIRELAEVGLKAGHAPNQVRERLTKGTPSVTVEGVKTRGQAPLPPGPLLDAGLEAARYGGISRDRIKQLHAHGYSVKALGLPVAEHPTSAEEVARHLQANLGF